MKIWKKSNLDERQEQALLNIEHNGCWIAYWGLFISMVVQFIIYGYEDIRSVAGEWVIFMILSIYISIDCTKHGIWDRHIKMNNKAIIACSFIGGVVAGLVMGIVQLRRPEGDMLSALFTGGFICVLTMVCIFVALKHDARKIREKNEEMSSRYDDDNEDEEQE